ncbi:MAG TPA: UTRA domain-containing protein, partial [Burkholderiales bacterium]|nr:UTRA domain-containing protein [Burkholderiales bacterium]
PPRVAEQLGTGPRKLLRWRRLYVLRGKPFAVTDVHLNAGRAQLTREQVDRNPTYSILETILKERVGRADVSIRYAQAAPELARALGLARGAPLMAFERVSYSAGGVPLEHSLYYARAEAYEFSLTVRGKLPITRSLKAASR